MVLTTATPRELERDAMLSWIARIGPITAEAFAKHADTTVASARARLLAARRRQLLARHHPLAGAPALYTVTRDALPAARKRGLDPCRVSAANARHLIACAGVAASFEHRYPDYEVLGEHVLRRDERIAGLPLASATLATRADGSRRLHRPDLVLRPTAAAGLLPIALEVELTLKAPRRLNEICLAWARCRCVAGVIYLAAPEVECALRRALERVHADERVAVVPLKTDALSGAGDAPTPASRC